MDLNYRASSELIRYDGIILDFRLVLSDVGGDGRGCRVVHILQRLQGDSFSGYSGLTILRIKADILLYRAEPQP